MKHTKKNMFALALAGAILAGPALATDLPMTVEDLVPMVEQHFTSGDVDAIMTLYGADSVVVPSPGAAAITGEENLRAYAAGLASALSDLSLTMRSAFETGDTALVIVDYAFETKGPDGELITVTGTGTEVLKQTEAGNWYYLIDNPWGVAKPSS